MGWKLKKSVVMVGMMGAGKSAVGRATAQLLGVPFRDSDTEIESAANMSIAEIFARDGEDFFRLKERQVLARLLEETPSILSTGGGAYMSEENRRLISARGTALWLDADLDLLWSRVRHRDTRPLLRTPDPKGTLRDLYERRVPVYRLAEIPVRSLPGLSVQDMAEKVVEALSTRADILEAA
ncbi:MAG: shikimate kinase [Rhodobacteraceae bacterium]|nr:shikimate kinase [Paracoccaceae bacterium]MBR9821873.1 shikimate kinase [Paracoccaceae bacterium]